MEREVERLKDATPAILVGRGSGITHDFEQSRSLILAAGLRVLKTAELSGIASEASATPLLEEAKSEPLCVLSRSELSDFVPKGLQDPARCFNPWKQVITTTRPEGAEDICERRSVWSTSVHLRHRFCRPFRAGVFLNQHLGLKPQAESFCPFGASIT